LAGRDALAAPNRRAAYAGAARHFKNGQPISRVQHNAGALHVLERPTSIPDNRRPSARVPRR
jgi:hypothetical protein